MRWNGLNNPGYTKVDGSVSFFSQKTIFVQF